MGVSIWIRVHKAHWGWALPRRGGKDLVLELNIIENRLFFISVYLNSLIFFSQFYFCYIQISGNGGAKIPFWSLLMPPRYLTCAPPDVQRGQPDFVMSLDSFRSCTSAAVSGGGEWRRATRQRRDLVCVCSFYPRATRDLRFLKLILSLPPFSLPWHTCNHTGVARFSFLFAERLKGSTSGVLTPLGLAVVFSHSRRFPHPLHGWSRVPRAGPPMAEATGQRTHQLPGVWCVCSGRVLSSLVEKGVVSSTGMCQYAVKYEKKIQKPHDLISPDLF